MKGIIVVIALMCASITIAYGHGASGNRIRQVCADPRFEKECFSYTAGVQDGLMVGVMQTLNAVAGSNWNVEHVDIALGYCPPKGSTDVQSMLIFKKYMEAYPEKTHLPAAHIALLAWREAWPCEDTQSQ